MTGFKDIAVSIGIGLVAIVAVGLLVTVILALAGLIGAAVGWLFATVANTFFGAGVDVQFMMVVGAIVGALSGTSATTTASE